MLLSANIFNLENPKNMLFGKEVIIWSANAVYLDMRDFADDKINVTYVTNFVMGRVGNIVGKGENVGYQHFLLFPQCFQKGLFVSS